VCEAWPARATIWLRISAFQARHQLGRKRLAPHQPRRLLRTRGPAPRQALVDKRPDHRAPAGHAAAVGDPPPRVHPLQLLLRYSETQPNQLRPENLILEPQAREPRRLVKLSQRLRSPFHAWKFGHLGHLEHARILPRPLAMSRSSRAIKPVVKKPARKTRRDETAHSSRSSVSTMPRHRASESSEGVRSIEPFGHATSTSWALAPYCANNRAAALSCDGSTA
jgi:hypothetical protein